MLVALYFVNTLAYFLHLIIHLKTCHTGGTVIIFFFLVSIENNFFWTSIITTIIYFQIGFILYFEPHLWSKCILYYMTILYDNILSSSYIIWYYMIILYDRTDITQWVTVFTVVLPVAFSRGRKFGLLVTSRQWNS